MHYRKLLLSIDSLHLNNHSLKFHLQSQQLGTKFFSLISREVFRQLQTDCISHHIKLYLLYFKLCGKFEIRVKGNVVQYYKYLHLHCFFLNILFPSRLAINELKIDGFIQFISTTATQRREL